MSLEVSNVTAGYLEDIYILRGVSMHAEQSKITTIIGPNGAGKSTLLKTIYGILKPKEGRVFYKGEDISGSKPHTLLKMGISYLPQMRSIFPYLTVEENLMLGGWIYRKDRKIIDDALEEVYKKYPNLKAKRKSSASFLSGGELKMLETAKALIANPNAILVDEPTAGLAPKFFNQIYDELKMLSREDKKTIILVDQNVKQAIELADYVYVLEMGQNTVEGPRTEFEAGRIREIIKDWLI